VAFAEWLGGGLLGLGRRAILQHSLQVSSKTLQVGDYFISFADLCVVYGGLRDTSPVLPQLLEISQVGHIYLLS
jgi:hypothetical protein